MGKVMSMRRPTPLAVGPTKQAAAQRGTADFPRRLFCQELAVLLDAGIPLYESLMTLREKEESVAVAQVLSTLTTALSQGKTLSQAAACFQFLVDCFNRSQPAHRADRSGLAPACGLPGLA
jgi:type II secretory pathway component PulF